MPRDLTREQRKSIGGAISGARTHGDALDALVPVVAQMLADERERIAQIVAAERLTDNTGHEADDAYNQAIDDALRAIREDQP